MRLRAGGPAVSARGRHGRPAVGIDLGATAIRATVVEQDNGRRAATQAAASPEGRGLPGDAHGRPGARGLVARQAGSEPLPPGAIVRGVVQESETVTAALRRLASSNRLRGRRVVLGISTPQVVVRPLSLPAMPPDKLRQALPFQARDVLPFPVIDAVLDFTPLPIPEQRRGEGAMVSGLLTAAPRGPVMAAVQAVENAGLSVERVDLSSFGVLRAIGSTGQAVEALVDIGSELTTIVIHRHGVPHVVRVVAFGGRRLTERVADGLGVAPDAAEATKCTVGTIGDSAPAMQVRDELRPMVSEVRASMRYFATTVGSVVDRVLLTGGTSALPGLADLLADELEVPVQVVTALRHLDTPEWAGFPVTGGPDPSASSSAVSVGLALGAAS